MSLDMQISSSKNNITNNQLSVKIQHCTGGLNLGDKDLLVANKKIWYNKYLNINVNYKCILQYLTLPLGTYTNYIPPTTYFDDILFRRVSITSNWYLFLIHTKISTLLLFSGMYQK